MILNEDTECTQICATLAAIILYTEMILLFNIDFMVTQYFYSIILLGATIGGGHMINGIGSVDFNKKIINTVSIGALLCIGNYNLNKSLVI